MVETSKPSTPKPGVQQRRPPQVRDPAHQLPIDGPVPLEVGEGDRPTTKKPGTGG